VLTSHCSGEWFHQQQKLNTKESKRGKLLKHLFKANSAPNDAPHGGCIPPDPQQQRQQATEMKMTTLAYYRSIDSIKSVHVSNGLAGYLFSAYNQQLKPTRKRYATRKLAAMPLPAIPDCPHCVVGAVE
jgi:hypothetical protein